MPNLNLTHNGNMNITSASLGSGGTLNVQYEPNLTGAITGWTFTPESERTDWESGETITIRYVPQFSGTVLTETFTVSGVDEAGIQRSDTSVLRQGYDTDLRHYFANLSPAGIFLLQGVIVNSSAMTENYMEINLTLIGQGERNYVQAISFGSTGGVYDRAVGIWYGYIDTTPPGPDTGGTVATSITINVASAITDSGQATASYSGSSAVVNLVYSSSDTSKARIDPVTGEITVLASGTVQFCVTDTVSNLSDCKWVDVSRSGGGQTYILEITYYLPGILPESEYYDYYVGTIIFNRSAIGNIVYIEDENGNSVPIDPIYKFPTYNDSTLKFYINTSVIPYKMFGRLGAPDSDPTSSVFDENYNIGPEGYIDPGYIKNLVIPEGITGYDAWSFASISSFVKDIPIPSTVTFIGDYAFDSGLETGLTIPDNVVSLGEGCFGGNQYVKEPIIGSGITSLPDWVFSECYQMTGITIPNRITSIGYRGFYLDYNLQEITIPSSVTSIGARCFEDCSGLTAMTFESVTPPTLGDYSNALGQTGYTFHIYVPCESLNAYKTAYPQYAHRIFCSGQEETYASNIQLVISSPLLDSGTATVVPTPSTATVFPVYSSSNPEIASVDTFTGEITVHRSGDVIITVRDAYTNISSEIDITCIKTIDPTPYKSDYLTFNIISGGTVVLKSGLETGITIDVRVNGGSWQTKKPKSGTTVNLSVSAGDKLEFRATRNRYNHSIFGSSGGCKFNLSGNIMSIVNPDPSNFSGRTSLPDNYIFRDLFRSCTGIVDASCLVMPATALTGSCYERMFMNCTNMTTAPLLPATATRTAAISPTSATWCYRGMFSGCSSLSYVKCKLVTVTESGTLDGWLSGVAGTGVFIKSPSANTSSLQIPSTWTIVNAT